MFGVTLGLNNAERREGKPRGRGVTSLGLKAWTDCIQPGGLSFNSRMLQLPGDCIRIQPVTLVKQA
jgi:hypothetical protein